MSVNASRSSSVAARTEYIDTYTSAISIRRYSFFPPARPVDDRAPTAVRSDACAFKYFGYSPRGTSSAPRTSTTGVDNRKDSLMMTQPSSLMRQPLVVLATVAMLLTAAGAQAQTVRFKTINDAV